MLTKIVQREHGGFFDSSLKTLKTVFGLVVHRVFVAEFTWTGKSKPGLPKKQRFKDNFDNIQHVFLEIVSNFHSNFNKKTLDKYLVGNIFKGAYE